MLVKQANGVLYGRIAPMRERTADVAARYYFVWAGYA